MTVLDSQQQLLTILESQRQLLTVLDSPVQLLRQFWNPINSFGQFWIPVQRRILIVLNSQRQILMVLNSQRQLLIVLNSQYYKSLISASEIPLRVRIRLFIVPVQVYKEICLRWDATCEVSLSIEGVLAQQGRVSSRSSAVTGLHFCVLSTRSLGFASVPAEFHSEY